MVDRQAILRRLTGVENEIAHEAKLWLASKDTESSEEGPANITVHRATQLWRVRFSNIVRRGGHLHGAEALLAKLESLAPNKRLDQFAFHSAAKAGSIFFERTNGQFVGAVIMDQRVKPQRESGHEIPERLASAGRS
jgi:hypothetical protein